jgi:hypothetical protein
MKHCRNLNFEDKPDYQLLLDSLTGLAEKEGINLKDKAFDWVVKDQKVPRNILAN